MWIIEDVHAADLQTLDLLIFLTQPLRLLNAFVVVTSRLEDARISEHAAERLNRVARDGIDVRLRGLGPETVQALAERAARRSISPSCSSGSPRSAEAIRCSLEYARVFASARGEPRAFEVLPHPRGDSWLVQYEGRSFMVRDMRGMQLLARLVERPGVEVHILALSGDDAQDAAESSAGEHLDAPTRDVYRRRLRELEQALDEAEADTDAGRLERLRRTCRSWI